MRIMLNFLYKMKLLYFVKTMVCKKQYESKYIRCGTKKTTLIGLLKNNTGAVVRSEL